MIDNTELDNVVNTRHQIFGHIFALDNIFNYNQANIEEVRFHSSQAEPACL